MAYIFLYRIILNFIEYKLKIIRNRDPKISSREWRNHPIIVTSFIGSHRFISKTGRIVVLDSINS